MGQLRELLTEYGPIAEVWFDGAKGEDAKDMTYDFDAWWGLVRQLQPDAVMFSDAGPDVRWIGNEHGFAGETNWSTFDKRKVGVGMAGIGSYLNTGEAGTADWVPGECDVSIRPGWFWHPDQEPKSLDQLLEIYFKSVGRNCLLLLNVPPTSEGLLDARDVSRLLEFRAALDTIFGTDLADGGSAEADFQRGKGNEFSPSRVLDGSSDSFWAAGDGRTNAELEVTLPAERRFNVIRIEEPIQFGQRISSYRVEALSDGNWIDLSRGTTIGYRKLDRLSAPVHATKIRITIDSALGEVLISEVGLHFDPTVDPEP